MRMSKMLGRRIKEDPKDAKTISHKYLVRGGYIRPPARRTHHPQNRKHHTRGDEQNRRTGGQNACRASRRSLAGVRAL